MTEDGSAPMPDHGDEPAPRPAPRPAERLRARAGATDRAARFEQRLRDVHLLRERRRRRRRAARVGWVVLGTALGLSAPLLWSAVVGSAAPGTVVLLAGAAVGAAVGAAGPVLRHWLARRRGASAWDAYHERYVLLGDPSARVRDADTPPTARGGPPRPSPRPGPPDQR